MPLHISAQLWNRLRGVGIQNEVATIIIYRYKLENISQTILDPVRVCIHLKTLKIAWMPVVLLNQMVMMH